MEGRVIASDKLLLSPKEVAEVTGLGMAKVREIMARESFPKVYNGTRILAIASEMDNWFKAHKGGQI
ncbi:MAG: DNA-binding protein [Ezakiella sp.]|nr:DNA-binding protein [Ezakiella sp.]